MRVQRPAPAPPLPVPFSPRSSTEASDLAARAISSNTAFILGDAVSKSASGHRFAQLIFKVRYAVGQLALFGQFLDHLPDLGRG